MKGPNITGNFTDLVTPAIASNGSIGWTTMGNAEGAFFVPVKDNDIVVAIKPDSRKDISQTGDGIGFSASMSSDIYKGSSTVQPKSITIQYLIRY